jgi:hypothetical protein
MTGLAVPVATGTVAFAALYLTAYHYLVLHGWAVRLSARYYGLPDPGPTPHAHWERGWDRRALLRAYGLGLASLIMLAASWLYSPAAGLAVTGAGEFAAAVVMRRSARRAAEGKRAGT